MYKDPLKKGAYRHFEKFLYKMIGKAQGEKLYSQAQIRLNGLIQKADFRENKAIKKHKTNWILPAVSLYKTLQENGFSKNESKNMIKEYTHLEAEKVAKQLRIIGKLPFFYRMFKYIFNKIMVKSYPKEGWTIEEVVEDKNTNAFKMKSCLYHETFTEYGCPELTPIFCYCDVISYKNMSQYVEFERTQTLATGGTCCDFKFLRKF